MLEKIREASKSWIVKVLLVFIALTFISWGGFYYVDKSGKDEVITVDGDAVSYAQYRTAYFNVKNNLLEQFKNIPNASEFVEKMNIAKMASDSLIERKLLEQTADKNEIVASNQEVATSIQQMPYFQDKNGFNNDVYQATLKANRYSPDSFEAEQRGNLTIQKLITLIQNSIEVSNDEVRDEYLLEFGKGNALFFSLSSEELAKDIKPTAEELQAFFDKEKALFAGPEKRKFQFVRFDGASYEDQVELDDDLIEDYYFDHTSNFETKEKVHAKHILLKVPKDASEEVQNNIRKKAEKIIQEIKEGFSFEEAAKKYSEDTSAQQGGDLGTFSRNQMVREFENAAFSLNKGEMTSKPVKTFYGYHIIKVYDKQEAHTQTVEEAKQAIIDALKVSEGKRVSKRFAKKFMADAASKGFQETAAEVPLAVEEVTTDAKLTEIKKAQTELKPVVKEIFTATNSAIVGPIETENGYIVAKFLESIPPEEPSFKDHKKEISAQFITKKAKELLAQKAEEIKAALKEGKSFKEIAEKFDAKTHATGLVGRGDSIADVVPTDERSFKDLLFTLTPKKPQLLEQPKALYLLSLQAPLSIDEEEFKKEKDAYKEKLLKEKQKYIYDSWLANIKKKAKVVISPTITSNSIVR